MVDGLIRGGRALPPKIKGRNLTLISMPNKFHQIIPAIQRLPAGSWASATARSSPSTQIATV
jgi:hypothetical protein